MPHKGERREKDGKEQTWHHELGWVDSKWLGWERRSDRMSDDEIQAEIDVATAEVKL